jgi:hypothetical protein
MQDMLDWRRNSTGKGSNRQGETHLTYQHLENEENGVDTPTFGERGCPLKILGTNNGLVVIVTLLSPSEIATGTNSPRRV